MALKSPVAVIEEDRLFTVSRIDDKTTKLSAKDLLSQYAWGALSPAEERRLHEAALEDQALFNDLVHEDLWREALADEGFRAGLVIRLRELTKKGRWAFDLRIAEWLKHPAIAVPAAVVAVALLVISVPRFSTTDEPEGPARHPDAVDSTIIGPKNMQHFPKAEQVPAWDAEALDRIWNVAELKRESGVSLELHSSTDARQFRAGEPLGIAFTLPRDAAVLILSKGPDAVTRQLFPSLDRWVEFVPANQRIELPSASQDLMLVADRPGLHRLRLILFPPKSVSFVAVPEGVERPSGTEIEIEILAQEQDDG